MKTLAFLVVALAACTEESGGVVEDAERVRRDARPVDAVVDAAPPPDAAPVDAAPDAAPVVDAAPDVPSCRPEPERCDGLDQDCDGRLDEEVPEAACETGLFGPCAGGRLRCRDGVARCEGVVQPDTEICDEGDNDCDGTVDEGIAGVGVRCDTGAPGPCANGVQRCTAGALVCEPGAGPQAEVCNAFDDDCDGRTDEDDGQGMACVGCVGGLPDVRWQGQCGEGQFLPAAGQCAEAAELHVLGGYTPAGRPVTVTVERVGPPLVLVLSNYDPTEWRVVAVPGVDLRQIILNGYERSVLLDGPAGVEVVDRTGVGNYFEACGYVLPSDGQGCETEQLIAGAERFTGLTLTSFAGCYEVGDSVLGTAPR